jgi:hypothetical protein
MRCPHTSQKLAAPFPITSGVPSLKEKIISESLERSWLDCGSSCLAQRFCVGYNYKENSRENEVNCQLTHTADHWFDKMATEGEDSDWTFYEAAAGTMVRISYLA